MGKIALCNVNYIDIANASEYRKKAIVIEGDTIALIQDMSAFTPHNDVQCYDYDDYWVIPGLIDMHLHITLPHQPSSPEYYLSPEEILDVSKKNLLSLRQIGVTTCRDMGSFAHSAEWVKHVFTKDTSLPHILTCGDILTYAQGHMHTYGQQILHDAEILSVIEQNTRCGCDFIKVTSDPSDTEACYQTPNPAFSEKLLKNIVTQATEKGLNVACHTYPSKEGVRRALVSDVRTIEHAVAFCENYGKKAYPNSYYVPTLATAIDMCGIESLDHINTTLDYDLLVAVRDLQEKNKFCEPIPDSIREWLQILIEHLPYNINSNQLLCTGSDAGCKGTNFHSLLREMLLLGAFGATNQQILTYAITNPCKALNLHTRGKIDKGYLADLIVLRKNPLKDITTLVNNVSVVCHGNIEENNNGE